MGKHGKNNELRNRKKQQSKELRRALEVDDDNDAVSTHSPAPPLSTASSAPPQLPPRAASPQLPPRAASPAASAAAAVPQPRAVETKKARAPREPQYDSDGEEIFDDDDDDDDDEDEDDEEEDAKETAYRKFVPPASLLAQAPVQDDTLMAVAALVGFFLSLAVSAALPRFGVSQHSIMASGMFSLLGYVTLLNLCTCSWCGSSSSQRGVKLSPIERVTPQMVFVTAACIGSMLGGMIGGALKDIPLY